MPLNIEASSVISGFWTAFKAAVASKSLLMQYDDDGIVYSIFAFDGPSIAYVTVIWKGVVPDNIITAGYAQATNDADKSDFETNYAPAANKPIGLQISQNGVAVASHPVLIAGSDGTNARSIKTATDGTVRVDPTGTTIQPVSGTVTANQGTANTLTNGWPVKVTDGTNTLPTGDTIARSIFNQISDGTTGPVAVKAASTAPVATDKALVVVLSPNQPSIPVNSGPSNATTGVIFGRAQNGSAGSLTAMRATAYIEQTVNFTGSVKSTSANDTSAGTGARTVKITYYDQTGAGPLTETVTLNGTTAVNLVNSNHCYIEKMEVLTIGSTGSNAGTITLHTGAGATGTTVGSIGFATNLASVGDNTTFWAHHYVATGITASIYELSGGTTGNQIGIIFLRVATPITSNAAEKQVSDFITVAANGPLSSRTLANAISVTGFARITAYTISNGSNTHYFTSFDYSEQ